MSDIDKLLSEDFEALDEPALKAKKLRLEIESLRRGLKPQTLTFWQRLNNYFQNNIGQIVTIIALFASLITPIWNFMSSYRQQQLVQINSAILETILNPTAEVDEAYLLKISAQDPSIVAPILFDQMNSKKITFGKTLRIFERMYDVNKNIVRYSWMDHVFYLFASDNKEVLEDELCLNALQQFERLDPIALTKDYIDLIDTMKFSNKSGFKKAFDVLRSNCLKSEKHESMCKYLNDNL